MAKLSTFKRLQTEDFDEEIRPSINKIASVFNSFGEEVFRALNGNLNDDNLINKTKSIEVKVNSSGVPTTTTQFQNPLFGSIEGIEVIRAENLTSTTTYPTNAPFISFSISENLVTIKHITGLQADNKYRLKIRIIGS